MRNKTDITDIEKDRRECRQIGRKSALNFEEEIRAYRPADEQERNDRETMLEFIARNRGTVLLRKNKIAHITSSSFILNRDGSKTLMVHHNIRGVWSWTGGHADGDLDLLGVAVREAKEETGAALVVPVTGKIAALDIFSVERHLKNGAYVGSHLHLNVAYLLWCGEDEPLRVKPDENSGVRWFPVERITPEFFSEADVRLYQKLLRRSRRSIGDVGI